MPHEVLRPLEDRRLRLPERHPGDPLELVERTVPSRLLLVLQLLEVHLAVAEPLLSAGHLDDPLVDLRLTLSDALLDLRDLEAVANLVLDLRAQSHRTLPRLDVGLAANRLRLVRRPRRYGAGLPRCGAPPTRSTTGARFP